VELKDPDACVNGGLHIYALPIGAPGFREVSDLTLSLVFFCLVRVPVKIKQAYKLFIRKLAHGTIIVTSE
jgi:hypothetical protein